MGCLKLHTYAPLHIAHTSNTEHSREKKSDAGRYQYKYNGKELQTELGLNMYDYGARNYDAALGRWFGIDNLSEKHFNFSPYTYTANNPIIFVDYDGNDYGVSVNSSARTITVKATYLVSSNNKSAFDKRGVNAFNKTSGKRIFVPGGVEALKNGRKEGYKINFDIQSRVDNSNFSDKYETVDSDQTGTLNTIDTHTSPYRGMEDSNGQTNNDKIIVRDNRLDTTTTTHEIAHSLGVAHSSDGGALPTQSININNNLVGEILAGVGIGGDNRNRNLSGENNLSAMGDGTLLNGSTNQGLENGQVISERRYNRIIRRLERREERRAKRESNN